MRTRHGLRCAGHPGQLVGVRFISWLLQAVVAQHFTLQHTAGYRIQTTVAASAPCSPCWARIARVPGAVNGGGVVVVQPEKQLNATEFW